jgi:hypothetical protein
MGYELNRLMEQYGVKTATIAPYGGAANPGSAPVAPTAPVAPEALRAKPVMQPGIDRTAFRADMQDWRGDKKQFAMDTKAYANAGPQHQTALDQFEKDKLGFEEATRKYGIDKPVYDTYVDSYQDRMRSTPMYNSPQFMTGDQTYTPTWNDQLAPPTYSFPASPTPTYSSSPAGPGAPGGMKFFNQVGFGNNAKYEPFVPTGPVDLSQYMYDPVRGGYVKKSGAGYYGMPGRGYADGGSVEGLSQKYEDEDRLGELIKSLALSGPAASDDAPIQYSDAYGPFDEAYDEMGPNARTLPSEEVEARPVALSPEEIDAIIAAVPVAPDDYPLPFGAAEEIVAPMPEGEPVVVTLPDPATLPLAEAPPEFKELVERYAAGDTAALDQIPARDGSPYEKPAYEKLELKEPATGIESTGIDLTAPAAEAEAEAAAELESMASKYESAPSMRSARRNSYHDELAAARLKSQAEQTAFEQMIGKMMASPEDAADSKAEMYFRLAAAFGSPTKTGHFGENLGLASKEMADYQKDRRSQTAERRKLAMEVQKMKMGLARDEYTTLRTLAAEEMRDERAMQAALLKEYIASGKPQSTAGKQALDEGFTPGTPDFKKRVGDIADLNIQKQAMAIQTAMAGMAAAQGNLAVAQGNLELKKQQLESSQKKLSGPEIKMKQESEDAIANAKQSLADLKEAFRLNPNSLGGGWMDKGQQWLYESAGSKDPKIVNTRIINNLLGSQGLAKMRSIFGGNPTEGERAILLELEGIGSKTLKEREAIMKRAYKVTKDRLEREEKRLKDISSGAYRTTEPSIEGE